MADGCENVTASCAATCSPSWSIRTFHRITMAARGNCGPQPHTAKLQVDSVPSGEPICSLAFDPSLAPQHDGVSMHIGQFVLSWTANLSFSRDEQIQIVKLTDGASMFQLGVAANAIVMAVTPTYLDHRTRAITMI